MSNYSSDWITKAPIVPEDQRHCLATVAPADTTHLEGVYEDFEVIGETAVMKAENGTENGNSQSLQSTIVLLVQETLTLFLRDAYSDFLEL